MFCKDCGRELPEGAEFCGNCGTKTVGALQTENEFQQSKKESSKERRNVVLWGLIGGFIIVVIAYVGYIFVIEPLIQSGKKGIEWASEKIQENSQRSTTNSSSNSQQGTTSNSANNQNVIDVDIYTFLNEIENNSSRAEQIYGEKVIRTRGIIRDFHENGVILGYSIDLLDFDSLYVTFISSERSKLVNLQKGQTITVKGVFWVGSGSGFIKNAIIE